MWKLIIFTLYNLGIEVVYDTEDNEFYKVESVDKNAKGEVYVLTQLVGEKSPISHFDSKRLIKLSDIYTGKIGLNQEIIGRISEKNQIIVQNQIENVTEMNQNKYRETSEHLQKINSSAAGLIGAGKVNLMPFSVYYSGEIKDVALKVEEISDLIFKNTDKVPTIKSTIADYEEAVKFAKKGDLFSLVQVGEKLKGRLNSQHAITKMKATVQRKYNFKKKLVITFTSVLFLSVLGYSAFRAASMKEAETIKKEVVNLDSSQVLHLIELAEMKHQKKITSWRKGIILEKTVGKTDKIEYIDSLAISKDPTKILIK